MLLRHLFCPGRPIEQELCFANEQMVAGSYLLRSTQDLQITEVVVLFSSFWSAAWQNWCWNSTSSPCLVQNLSEGIKDGSSTDRGWLVSMPPPPSSSTKSMRQEPRHWPKFWWSVGLKSWYQDLAVSEVRCKILNLEPDTCTAVKHLTVPHESWVPRSADKAFLNHSTVRGYLFWPTDHYTQETSQVAIESGLWLRGGCGFSCFLFHSFDAMSLVTLLALCAVAFCLLDDEDQTSHSSLWFEVKIALYVFRSYLSLQFCMTDTDWRCVAKQLVVYGGAVAVRVVLHSIILGSCCVWSALQDSEFGTWHLYCCQTPDCSTWKLGAAQCRQSFLESLHGERLFVLAYWPLYSGDKSSCDWEWFVIERWLWILLFPFPFFWRNVTCYLACFVCSRFLPVRRWGSNIA